MPLPITRLALAATAVLAAACSGDDAVVDPQPGASVARSDTLDTRVAGSATATRWVYVSLANPGQPLTVTDDAATTSTAWDVAFNGFATRANAAAGVSIYCVCQNSRSAPASGTAAYYGAMTSASEQGDFDAVRRADVPADAQFRADTLLGIGDWFVASASGARTLQPNVYVVQRPNGAGFAKLQVTAVQNATGATPGRVTLRYATVNPARTAVAATQTATVDVPASGRVAFSFATNAVTTGNDWDVAFEGWRIRTNSGSSATAATPSWGAYNATALLNVASFDGLLGTSVSPTSNAYRTDGYGVFGERPTWYYDSPNRTALPTYDVYLVKRGTNVYKVQVTGYRKQSGADILGNHVAFRSARLSG